MDPTSDLLPHDLLRILKANNADTGTNIADLAEMSQRLSRTPEGVVLLVEIAANATALCLTLSTEIDTLHTYMSEVIDNLEDVLHEYDLTPGSSYGAIGTTFSSKPSDINMMP